MISQNQSPPSPCCWELSIVWNRAKKDLISPNDPCACSHVRADLQPAKGRAPVPYYRSTHAALTRLDGKPTAMTSLDSFRCCKPLKAGSRTYAFYSLVAAGKNG